MRDSCQMIIVRTFLEKEMWVCIRADKLLFNFHYKKFSNSTFVAYQYVNRTSLLAYTHILAHMRLMLYTAQDNGLVKPQALYKRQLCQIY